MFYDVVIVLCSQELEAIEEQWHNETSDLAALVNRLQEENRRITKQANSPKHEPEPPLANQLSKCDGRTNLLNASDFQIMQRLRAQLEKQRDELMCRDQEIQEKNNEIENVSRYFRRLLADEFFIGQIDSFIS